MERSFNMPKVFVTRPIPEVGINLLRDKGMDVVLNSDNRVLSKDELKTHVAGVDAILSLLTDKIDGEVLDAAGPQLRIVANLAVGYDNIDIQAAKQRNVMVTNTPGVLTDAVAEHAIALLVTAAKRIVEADRYIRSGQFKQWEPLGFLGPQLTGKTIGVVGLGRIGSVVAQIAQKGYQMKVLYYDIKRNEDFEKEVSALYMASVDELLPLCDFVSIHVPLLDSTHHLINAERLAKMKKSAILVNTSRGPVVDEQALVEALKSGQIAYAGLDVFEHEPELTQGLSELPNVVLTPHIASATIEAREAMAELAAESIIVALSGQTPTNLVS